MRAAATAHRAARCGCFRLGGCRAIAANSSPSFQRLADDVQRIQNRVQDAEAGKATEVADVFFDAEEEITKRIERYLSDMPMKMSPVSVFYILREDIRKILKRATDREARSRTSETDASLKSRKGDSSAEGGKGQEPAGSSQRGATAAGKASETDASVSSEKSDSPVEGGKSEHGYSNFNAWRRQQGKKPKDEAFELFMKLYRSQRIGLSIS